MFARTEEDLVAMWLKAGLDMPYETWLDFQGITKPCVMNEGDISYVAAQLADEQYYSDNYPNPPATHMLISSWKYRQLSETSWIMNTGYRFSRLEWNSLVNWNKDADNRSRR